MQNMHARITFLHEGYMACIEPEKAASGGKATIKRDLCN